MEQSDDNFFMYIDTSGGHKELPTQNEILGDDRFIKQALREFREEQKKEEKPAPLVAKTKTIYEQFYEDMGWIDPKSPNAIPKRGKQKYMLIDTEKDLIEDKAGVKKVLATSNVLTDEFKKQHAVPTPDVGDRILKRERQKEREKTKGKNWFNLPATEITEEVKKDLEVLQMRSVLDPKHFYKKNDLKVLPKYFQIGTVEDSALDFHDRLTKKQRKRTLVDELLADAEFNKYNKKKYTEIVAEKQKTHYAAYRAAKKLKRRRK